MAGVGIAAFLLGVIEEEEEERLRIKEQFRQLRLERKYLRDVTNPYELPSHYFRKFYR